MNRFRQKISAYMAGRYGMDAFGKFLNIDVILFLILSMLFKNPVKAVLYWCGAVLLIFEIFRMLSKNHVRRGIENRRYLTVKNRISRFFSLLKNRFRDRKTHIYRHCPQCRSVLRLKRIKGEHKAVCPCCGNSFRVKVR